MEPLKFIGPAHYHYCCLCILGIIYIPKLFVNSSKRAKLNLAYAIIALILVNQSMDLYFEGYLGGRMETWASASSL